MKPDSMLNVRAKGYVMKIRHRVRVWNAT